MGIFASASAAVREDEMQFGPVSSVGHAGRGDAIALSFLNRHGALVTGH